MKILFFTASGNSLYVAKAFGGELLSIPEMVKKNQYEFTDDKIGIVFPIYSNKVQPYIEAFLLKAKFNCDYLFAVATYGVFAAAAPSHLQSIAQKANYQFSYINTVSMVDSWIPGFKMENQIKKEHKKGIEKQLETIVSDVNTSKIYVKKAALPGRLMTRLQIHIAKNPKNTDTVHGGVLGNGIKKYVTIEDTCIGCGICAQVCPLNNITVTKDPKKVSYGSYCVSCFACTHNCPTNSIRLKGERSRGRFRNANVTLQEIINANDTWK